MVTFEGDNPGDASIGTLETVLSLAESRIYREVQMAQNEKAFSGTVTSNAYTLPSDFRSPSLVYFGGKPLEPVSPEYLYEQIDTGGTGDCRVFAQVGSSFKFYPAASDGATVQGTYFFAYPALSSSTIGDNALFLAANDLFLYACMVEAAPMYGFQDQVSLWEAKYQQVRDALNTQNARAAFGAGRMKRRPSTTLMG